MKEFNGDINFDSKYGIGSTFEFTFLLEKPEENQSSNLLRIKNPVMQTYARMSVSEYQIFNIVKSKMVVHSVIKESSESDNISIEELSLNDQSFGVSSDFEKSKSFT